MFGPTFPEHLYAVAAQAYNIVLPFGEQITMLLALVRSRLTDAIDVAAIRARLLRGSQPVEDRKYVAIAPLSNSLLRDWPARTRRARRVRSVGAAWGGRGRRRSW